MVCATSKMIWKVVNPYSETDLVDTFFGAIFWTARANWKFLLGKMSLWHSDSILCHTHRPRADLTELLGPLRLPDDEIQLPEGALQIAADLGPRSKPAVSVFARKTALGREFEGDSAPLKASELNRLLEQAEK